MTSRMGEMTSLLTRDVQYCATGTFPSRFVLSLRVGEIFITNARYSSRTRDIQYCASGTIFTDRRHIVMDPIKIRKMTSRMGEIFVTNARYSLMRVWCDPIADLLVKIAKTTSRTGEIRRWIPQTPIRYLFQKSVFSKYDQLFSKYTKTTFFSKFRRHGSPTNSSTLGRLSKSTSRLSNSDRHATSNGLITSISRSTRDLTQDDTFSRRPLGAYDQNRYTSKLNGFTSPTSRSNVDAQKKIFMKGLMERAPELYRTLHGSDLDENRTTEPIRTSTPLRNGKLEYSTSFRSSNTSSPLDRMTSTSPYYQYRTDSPDGVNRSVVRRGSHDTTETVRYTTSSNNPARPSVTNTVQSVTKKRIPIPGGGEQRIHSTETKTVTKSKFRSATPEYFDGASKYPSSNGGVVIEVRNTRK
ncbi:unnamed protein product [Nesidiocoris tenuis]|uniref:Uncharacterized protein n=1 Tax=Nesidiocoris tenuis TaxID=355587 RepID=A0A6H5HHC0_9HEMI|nr:unnamed protein product [Nesidiocoris tenuis]